MARKEDTGQVGEGRRREIEKYSWSGKLGLMLVTLSLVVFIFLLVPMEHADCRRALCST